MVLDGGLATELEARGCELSTDLWSAAVLFDAPEMLYRVHLDYLLAGADCITSASYQASYPGLISHGLSAEQAEEVLARSVSLAVEARNEFWRDPSHRPGRIRPLVAASVGPYGAYLADGSEYTGDYGLNEEDLFDFHQRRWSVLVEAGADLMACETIPSRLETRALRRLVQATSSVPSWISLSCGNETSLADGSSLQETVGTLVGTPNLVAVGVNCVHPELVRGLVQTIGTVWPKPILAYPNSGEVWDAHRHRWLGRDAESDVLAQVEGWIDAGARILGGCCRTGPDQIRRLRRILLARAASSSS